MVATRHPEPTEMEAYERVLTDAMAGDATLFARQDYVEEAWRIVDPILNTSPGNGIRKISSDASATPVYIVPAEEDWMIAIHVSQMAASASANGRI